MDLLAFNSKFRDFLIEELEGIYSSEKLESLSVVFEDLVKIPGLKFTICQESLVGAKKISLLISMK
jgi:hypothetical protein